MLAVCIYSSANYAIRIAEPGKKSTIVPAPPAPGPARSSSRASRTGQQLGTTSQNKAASPVALGQVREAAQRRFAELPNQAGSAGRGPRSELSLPLPGHAVLPGRALCAGGTRRAPGASSASSGSLPLSPTVPARSPVTPPLPKPVSQQLPPRLLRRSPSPLAPEGGGSSCRTPRQRKAPLLNKPSRATTSMVLPTSARTGTQGGHR